MLDAAAEPEAGEFVLRQVSGCRGLRRWPTCRAAARARRQGGRLAVVGPVAARRSPRLADRLVQPRYAGQVDRDGQGSSACRLLQVHERLGLLLQPERPGAGQAPDRPGPRSQAAVPDGRQQHSLDHQPQPGVAEQALTSLCTRWDWKIPGSCLPRRATPRRCTCRANRSSWKGCKLWSLVQDPAPALSVPVGFCQAARVELVGGCTGAGQGRRPSTGRSDTVICCCCSDRRLRRELGAPGAAHAVATSCRRVAGTAIRAGPVRRLRRPGRRLCRSR